MIDFGSRLRMLRKEKKLRQKDLAKHLGVAQTTIANYENNSRFPEQRILNRLADFFNVSLDYLLGRSEIRNFNKNWFNTNSKKFNDIPAKPLSTLAKKYLNALLEGNREKAAELIFNAVNSTTDIKMIYNDVFARCLKEIGRLWEMDEIDVAQEHYFSYSTQLIMDQLYKHLPRPKAKNKRTVVTLCPSGELHDIGIRMVNDFFEMDGWNTYYLGANVPAQSIINTIKSINPDILAVSATTVFNLETVKHLIQGVKSTGGTSNLKVIVGGLAFKINPDSWKEVKADGYAESAEEAVKLASELVKNAEGEANNGK